MGEEIGQHLYDARAVRHDQGQVRRHVDVEVAAAAAAQEAVSRLVHQDRGVGGFGRHRQRAGLDAGHVQQVVDEADHVVGLVVDDAVELAHLREAQVG